MFNNTTIVIFNNDLNTNIKFNINNNYIEGYYLTYKLHGQILSQSSQEIKILWNHSDPKIIAEYIKHNNDIFTKKMQYDAINSCNDSKKNVSNSTNTITQKNNLPKDFKTEIYKLLNSDLSNMTTEELEQHYLCHGIYENREYKLDINIDINENIEYIKSSIVFINHESSLTGAPIFIYDFVKYLKENNILIDPIIIEPFPRQHFDHYDINKYYHFNDKTKLLNILQKINPTLIYSNSINLLFNNIKNFKEFQQKVIFHFHESIENINLNNLAEIKNNQIFVVADKIKKQLENFGCTNVFVFPPFLDHIKISHIESQAKRNKPIISNKYRKLDTKKPVVGMSGTICERKGFLLFYNLAKYNSDKEFIWIGGDKNWIDRASDIYKQEFIDLDNFFHIPQTTNPYPFYNIINYFVLTSTNDPCPIVVLESLLLNKKVICLKNNIFYDHSQCKNVISIDNTNQNDNQIIKNISLHLNNLSFKNQIGLSGKLYIKKYFSKPYVLNIDKNNNKEYFLLFNFYIDNSTQIDKMLKFYINLINMFNIKNNFKYQIIITLQSNNWNTKLKHKLKNKLKTIVNLTQLLFLNNIGWNLNGFMRGIRYIFERSENPNHCKILYAHNKSNHAWKQHLISIFYASPNDIDFYDTIVNDNFFVACPLKDPNRKLMEQDILFNIIAKKKFNYIGGLFFITSLNNLKILYQYYNHIFSNLTKSKTISNLWVKSMKNNKIFNQYYNHYKNDVYNSPIDQDSKTIVEQNLATNFLDLYYVFGKKGIPDLHYEHALERYIGYLISNNKNILTVTSHSSETNEDLKFNS